MTSVHKPPSNSTLGVSSILGHEVCESYWLFPGETALGEAFRTFLYCLGLAYCFIGLSAITARFFRSMENVVKQTRAVVKIDPHTNSVVVSREKVWNYTIADITLLAFGTSFPQISLATIDALRNLGDLYAGGQILCIFSISLKGHIKHVIVVTGCAFIWYLAYFLKTVDDWDLELQSAFSPCEGKVDLLVISLSNYGFMYSNETLHIDILFYAHFGHGPGTLPSSANLVNLCILGLGPGTLVGSAAFDLFPIHAVCVLVPKAGELKKISDLGVWIVELFWSFWAYFWLYIILKVWTPDIVTLWEALLTVFQFGLLLLRILQFISVNGVGLLTMFHLTMLFLPVQRARGERPEDWVPEEGTSYQHVDSVDDEHSEIIQIGENDERRIVDIFSIHSGSRTGAMYHNVPGSDLAESSNENLQSEIKLKEFRVLSLWKQQFVDALMLESAETKKLDSIYVRALRISWQSLLAPWRLMFALVPPCQIAHGWIAFICSLIFISGIAYVVTQLTDLISCVTGINAYVIAFTALASGTSWPDLVASKIAAERQTTADSAIANITCSNSVNIYVGIGVPWLIDTAYNFIVYREPLRIQNAAGLSFSLLVFFSTSVGCISVLVLRRLTLGAELGGPKPWAWLTSIYFMLLWLIFVVLSSLKVSGII